MEVAVFNDNIYPYKEKFRDRNIDIEPKGHIMMDEDEAKIFLGTFQPPMLDADGNHMEQGFKKLRILGKKRPEAKTFERFICHQCNMEFKNQNDLETHIVALHVDKIIAETDEDKKAKKEIEQRAKELSEDEKKAEALKLAEFNEAKEAEAKSKRKPAGANKYGL